jgi:hypothetical protein
MSLILSVQRLFTRSLAGFASGVTWIGKPGRACHFFLLAMKNVVQGNIKYPLE